MKIFALSCAAVIVLIACSQETSSHDVEWYLSHPKEHQEQSGFTVSIDILDNAE